MAVARSAALAFGLAVALNQIAMGADDVVGRLNALEPHFHMYRPAGAGPFPALLFASGCRGFAPRNAPKEYTDIAESWRAKGYVVVFVDSLAASGMDRCGGYFSLKKIGADVLTVAKFLQGQPFVHASRITAIGWSLGGGGVLAALSEIAPGDKSPLHAVVAISPACGALHPWKAAVPALVLMGAVDEIVPPDLCKRVFSQMPPGALLETHVYPDAGHVFTLPGHGYSPSAAAAAAREVDQFLAR